MPKTTRYTHTLRCRNTITDGIFSVYCKNEAAARQRDKCGVGRSRVIKTFANNPTQKKGRR